MFHNVHKVMNIMKQQAPDNFLQLEDIDDETGIPAPGQLEFGPGSLEAIHKTCEAIGQIIESWGFKRTMGNMWAFLYLCPEPATARDICKFLKVSPALVSMTLQELLRWGVVRRLSPVGQRRDYYVAEHDVWKMIRKVFQEREKTQMERVREQIQEAMKALESEALSKPELRSKRTRQFQKIRLEDLAGITDEALVLLNGFVSQGRLDIKTLFSMLKPANPLAMALNRTRS